MNFPFKFFSQPDEPKVKEELREEMKPCIKFELMAH